MGQTLGNIGTAAGNIAQSHPFATALIKGGLTGLGQGLQQQQNPNAQFNFQPMQQGFQDFRAQQKLKKPPMQTGINGNSNPFPSGPDTGLYG